MHPGGRGGVGGWPAQIETLLHGRQDFADLQSRIQAREEAVAAREHQLVLRRLEGSDKERELAKQLNEAQIALKNELAAHDRTKDLLARQSSRVENFGYLHSEVGKRRFRSQIRFGTAVGMSILGGT
jgi:hypothetical protein